MAFIVKRMIVFIALGLTIMSCDNFEDTETRKDSKNSKDSDFSLVIDFFPKKYVRYVSKIDSSKKGYLEATLEFDSKEIVDYSGGLFSVKVFLKDYIDTPQKNNSVKYSLEVSAAWKAFYEEQETQKYIVGQQGSFIGENTVSKKKYKSLSKNKNLSNIEHLIINKTDHVLFKEIYKPSKDSNLFGIYEYKTSLQESYAATYQIKVHSFDKFTHSYFLYAKKFTEDFLIKN